MAIPKIKKIDEKLNYYHVRFREPSRFKSIRIPEWAARVANSISVGAKVKTGILKDSGNWKVQSVMIRKERHDKRSARRLAKKIIRKIEG